MNSNIRRVNIVIELKTTVLVPAHWDGDFLNDFIQSPNVIMQGLAGLWNEYDELYRIGEIENIVSSRVVGNKE